MWAHPRRSPEGLAKFKFKGAHGRGGAGKLISCRTAWHPSHRSCLLSELETRTSPAFQVGLAEDYFRREGRPCQIRQREHLYTKEEEYAKDGTGMI